MGITYDAKGEMVKVLDYYQKSLSVKQQMADKKGISSTLNNIGVVYYNQGNVPKALEHFLMSIRIKGELGDMAGIANTYNNMGVICKDDNRFEEAIEYYRKANEIYIKTGDRRSAAVVLHNQSLLLHRVGKTDEGISNLRQSLAISREIGAKQSEVHSLASLGELYLAKGKYDSSIFFIGKARSLALQIDDKRNLAQVEMLGTKYYFANNNLRLAIEKAQEALELSSGIGTLPIERDAHNLLYLAYSSVGDFRRSLHHHINYISLRDSLGNADKQKQILQLQLQAKFDREMEAERLSRESEKTFAEALALRQRMLSWFLFFIAILVLGVATIVYFYFRYNKKLAGSLLLQKQEIEQQKEEIIAQRDELESQRNLVVIQRDRIMELFTEISESIMYAQRIQKALFPSHKRLTMLLGEYFLFTQPKQVVSGDFCWAVGSGPNVYLAVVDCTGHGIPGGFMSTLGITLLNELILHKSHCTPDLMLDYLREKVIITLDQKDYDDESLDGMDVCLVTLNRERNRIQYAGVNIPLWVVKQNGDGKGNPLLLEFRPDRMPISYHMRMDPFRLQTIEVEKGDMIYMFTDGYSDQFGGPATKKFQLTQLRSLLLSISHLSASEQRQIVAERFAEWQGDMFQVDDVLVLGVRV